MFGLFDSKIRPNSAEFSSNEYSYWLTKHNMSWASWRVLLGSRPRRLCQDSQEVRVQKLIKYSRPSLREVISYAWIVWFQNLAKFSSTECSYWLTKNNMSRILPHNVHAKNVHIDWPKITVQEGFFGVGFLAWVSWQPCKKAVSGSLRPEVSKILTSKLKGSH